MTLARELNRVFSQYRPKGGRWFGLLGQTADAGAEIEVSGRPGWYWVRVDRAGSGYQPGIFQSRVGFRPLVNLPVIIEADPFTGVRYITAVDQFMVEASGQTAVPALTLEEHATTHEWDGSDQLNWIHTLQIMNLRVQPGSVTRHVTVQGGAAVVDGEYVFQPDTTDLDLTSYWPTSGTKWVLITLSSAGVIAIQDDGAMTLNALEPPAEGTIALAAIPLRASATDLTWPDDFRVDLRFASATAAGIPTSSGNVWGTGYPAFDSAEWAKVGRPEVPDGSSTATLWGFEAQNDTDYVFVGTEYVSNDRADGIIVWGDNPADLLRIVFRETGESPLDILTFHANGDVDLEVGSLTLADGETVDGVDISAHAANAAAHHAPLTLDANADAILSLSTQVMGLDTQAANVVLAGPTSGAAAVPTMRGLVFADIPSSSNPGAAAAVLATNTSGQVQLTGLGIGIDPRYNVGIRSQPTFNYVNVWLYGISNVLQHAPVSDGDTILIGYENKVIVTGTANNSGALYSARQSIGWQSSGAITSVIGEYIRVDENYGYIGTIYGVMIHDIAQGSYGAAWSLYSTDANAPSYFAGNLLIGTTDSTGLGSSGGLKIASNFIHTGTVFESGDTTPKFGSYTLTIPATGTVALGTGTNTYLAFWSGTNTLSSTSALTWDGSQLTVGNDLYMTGAGWVGLGTTPVVGRRVVIAVSATDPAYTIRGMSCVATVTYTSDSAQLLYAQTNNVNLGVSSTKTHSAIVMGVTSTVSLTSTFAGTQSGAVYGIYNALTCAAGAAGTVSGAAYVYTSAISFAAGTTAWSTIYGYYQATWDSAAMNGNTVTNAYGIYLSSISAGATLNYAIYTNAGKVRLGDNVLIGTSTDGMTANGSLAIAQDLAHRGTKAGFFNTAPVTKPTVSGSRGGNAALASLLTALAGLGLLTDSSTA